MELEWKYHSLPEVPCPLCGSDRFHFEVHRYDEGRIVQCDKCQHHFLNPAPSQEMLDSLLSVLHTAGDPQALLKQLREWHDDPNSVYQYAYRYLEQNGGYKGKRIVEIGCGPGLVLNECKQKGADVLGIDPAHASKEHAKTFFGIDVMLNSLEEIMSKRLIEKHSFDLCIAFELIEHLRNPKLLLEAAHYFLKPGGKLILSTPNFELYHKMGKHAPPLHAIVDHLHYFDVHSLKSLIEANGLRVDLITSVHALKASTRQKTKYSRIPITNALWKVAKQFPLVKDIKNYFFSKLDEVEEKNEAQIQDPFNGLELFCAATLPLSV